MWKLIDAIFGIKHRIIVKIALFVKNKKVILRDRYNKHVLYNKSFKNGQKSYKIN